MADSSVTADLQATAAPLGDRPLLAVLGATLPVPLAIAFGTGAELVGSGPVGVAGKNLAYGTASLLVLAGVYAVLSGEDRTALRLRRPSERELSWAFVGFPVGTALYLGASAITSAAGLEMAGYEYGLGDPITVAAVVFGAVLVSPIAEEVLFRGLVLGTLLGRGWHPILAGGAGILAFGVLHLPLLGPAGVIAMGAWSVVPTVLRLRFDGLGGAWVVHQLNNLWAYLGVVALGLG